jgi:hypothetical protein
MLKEGFNYIYYDTPDGFSTVTIYLPEVVSIKGTFYDIAQKRGNDKYHWGDLMFIDNGTNPNFVNNEFVTVASLDAMSKKMATRSYTEQDQKISLDLMYKQENLERYFPLGHAVLKFMTEQLKLNERYRFLILTDKNSGMDAFRVMFRKQNVIEGKPLFVIDFLDTKRGNQANGNVNLKFVISDKLKQFSNNRRSNVLIYDTEAYAEGSNLWRYDIVINVADYEGDPLKFLQAIGRANRVCRQSPLFPGKNSRTQRPDRLLKVKSFVVEKSRQQILYNKAFTGLRNYLANRRILQQKSIFLFEGDSNVIIETQWSETNDKVDNDGDVNMTKVRNEDITSLQATSLTERMGSLSMEPKQNGENNGNKKAKINTVNKTGIAGTPKVLAGTPKVPAGTPKKNTRKATDVADVPDDSDSE